MTSGMAQTDTPLRPVMAILFRMIMTVLLAMASGLMTVMFTFISVAKTRTTTKLKCRYEMKLLRLTGIIISLLKI